MWEKTILRVISENDITNKQFTFYQGNDPPTLEGPYKVGWYDIPEGYELYNSTVQRWNW
jgi:hypothetical protein